MRNLLVRSGLGPTVLNERADWLVGKRDLIVEVWTITPDDAKALIERNTNNRPMTAERVKKYLRHMLYGDWQFTGEPVIFSLTGVLLNGQHRLEACIKSGRPFKTLAVFGIEDAAFSFMDQGGKRTPSDIFAHNKVKNARMIAAATKWLWRYEKYGMTEPSTSTAPTPEELYQYYLQHEGLQDSYIFGHRCNVKGISTGSLSCSLHYICAKLDQRAADQFFHQLATGEGATKRVARLRDRLMAGRKGSERLQDTHAAAFIMKVWNGLRGGKAVDSFVFREGEEFPKAL